MNTSTTSKTAAISMTALLATLPLWVRRDIDGATDVTLAVLLALVHALDFPISARQLRSIARVGGELHRRAVAEWLASVGVYGEPTMGRDEHILVGGVWLLRPRRGEHIEVRGVRIEAGDVQHYLDVALRAVANADNVADADAHLPGTLADAAVAQHALIREAMTAEILATAADRAAEEAGTFTGDTTTLRFVTRLTTAPLRLAA